MKTNFIYLLFLILGLASCSNQGDRIISEIEKTCKIHSKKDKTKEGEDLYSYTMTTGNKPFEVYSRTRGLIETTLKVHPVSVSEDKYSFSDERM